MRIGLGTFVAGIVSLAVLGAQAAAASCGAGYGYAGLEGAAPAGGIAATVAALTDPSVEAGHVAAWVGVGGYGLGPGGTDEWLQVGVATRARGTSGLYVEWKTPHHRSRYVDLPGGVAPGAAHRLTVVEQIGRGGVWQAFVDGTAVGPRVVLPGSHSRFDPVVVAESWDGGQASCNRFAYRFGQIAVESPSGAWAPLGTVYKIVNP